MKSIIVTVLTVTIISLCSVSLAMIPWDFWVKYNIFLPIGNTADVYKLSPIGFAGGADFYIHPRIGPMIEVGFQKMQQKDPPDGMGSDYGFNLIYFLPGVRFNILPLYAGETKFVPFAEGGTGFFMFRNFAAEGAIVPENVNKAGIFVGGGIDYFITKAITIDIVFDYLMPFTEGQKTHFAHFKIGIDYLIF